MLRVDATALRVQSALWHDSNRRFIVARTPTESSRAPTVASAHLASNGNVFCLSASSERPLPSTDGPPLDVVSLPRHTWAVCALEQQVATDRGRYGRYGACRCDAPTCPVGLTNPCDRSITRSAQRRDPTRFSISLMAEVPFFILIKSL